jgi:hypothetical protein
MQPAAHQSLAGTWRVLREGSEVAAIDLREEGGTVVVTTTVNGEKKPHRFPSLAVADGFLRDLTTSFAYLGCEVTAS